MDTALSEPLVERKSRRARRLRRGALCVFAIIAAGWIASVTGSLILQHSSLRTKITARLEAAFGRPVSVGSYAFSLWGGPVLEAQSVRIGEDPRFGNEYFLYADSISVEPRWLSLLRGRIALGTLSLSGASLNLVRAGNGDWNIAEWLPRPAPSGGSGGAAHGGTAGSARVPFRRIEISDSRIDLKRGNEKLAFAFVDVNGTVAMDGPGRWRIDLTASPWRAAATTQQPGVIKVTGHVGGTSSRLRPAALKISWEDTSISDFFRLLRGDDYGIRGSIAVSVNARTEPGDPRRRWLLSGQAEASGLHRWDLAARSDNPSMKIAAKEVLVDPGLSYVRVLDARIEGAHSSARANAAFDWTTPLPGSKPTARPVDFVNVLSSQIDLRDVLDWVRAFHPGVANGASARGALHATARFAGWPPELASASVDSNAADLLAPGIRGPVHIGPIALSYGDGAIRLRPVTIAWDNGPGAPPASFRVEAATNRRRGTFPSWHIAGNTEDLRGITAAAAALGVSSSRNWELEGPFSCDLRWQGSLFPWGAQPVGKMTFGAAEPNAGGASLRVSFLNFPVTQIHARAEWKQGGRQITISSAKAFGSNWSGKIQRRSLDSEWHFALGTDRLSAADLDRWFDPRWRENLLDRMFPFFGSPVPSALPDTLRASGTVSLGQLAVERLAVTQLQGNLTVAGRNIDFSDARGQFYGGKVSGILRAKLLSAPEYHAEVAVDRVQIADLAKTFPSFAAFAAESASARISFDARGAGRADLLGSLSCRGVARASYPEFSTLQLWKELGQPKPSGGTRFTDGSAEFSCLHKQIDFHSLQFTTPDGSEIEGTGTAGLDGGLDLRFRTLFGLPRSLPRRGTAFRISGSLTAPQVIRLNAIQSRR